MVAALWKAGSELHAHVAGAEIRGGKMLEGLLQRLKP
jgi:hypothetical protein